MQPPDGMGLFDLQIAQSGVLAQAQP
jgi:hypothetical protein